MKKIVLKISLVVLLLASILITLTACGEEKDDKKKESKGGKNSSKEVIEAFVEASAKGKVKEAKKYVDVNAFITCDILDDIDADFDEVYKFLGDTDKGLDYLEKHYEDLIEQFEDSDIPIDEDALDSIADLKERCERTVENTIEYFSDYPDAKVKNIKEEENYTDYDEESLEFYTVTVDFGDGDEDLDVWTIEIDGSYYVVAVD